MSEHDCEDGVELKTSAELAEVGCMVTLIGGLIVVLPVVTEMSIDELRGANPVAVDSIDGKVLLGASRLIELGTTVGLLGELRDVGSTKDSLLLTKLLEVPTAGAGLVLDELLELDTGTTGSTAVKAVISNVFLLPQ